MHLLAFTAAVKISIKEIHRHDNSTFSRTRKFTERYSRVTDRACTIARENDADMTM